jgi:hypothetical protein
VLGDREEEEGEMQWEEDGVWSGCSGTGFTEEREKSREREDHGCALDSGGEVAAGELSGQPWHSQLVVAQCDDRERVLYAAGQLRGSALDRWESYPVQDRDSLTWVQFRERFRSHHIPEGIMKMKQKEFRALKQVNLNRVIYNFF